MSRCLSACPPAQAWCQLRGAPLKSKLECTSAELPPVVTALTKQRSAVCKSHVHATQAQCQPRLMSAELRWQHDAPGIHAALRTCDVWRRRILSKGRTCVLMAMGTKAPASATYGASDSVCGRFDSASSASVSPTASARFLRTNTAQSDAASAALLVQAAMSLSATWASACGSCGRGVLLAVAPGSIVRDTDWESVLTIPALERPSLDW